MKKTYNQIIQQLKAKEHMAVSEKSTHEFYLKKAHEGIEKCERIIKDVNEKITELIYSLCARSLSCRGLKKRGFPRPSCRP